MRNSTSSTKPKVIIPTMKAKRGKVLPSNNCSWRFAKRESFSKAFNWHYHPEYEICLTLNSIGSKHIGDHVSHYEKPHLVLIGSDLPHSWQAKAIDSITPHTIYVIQIPVVWLTDLVKNNPELAILENILKLSLRGIEFSAQTTIAATTICEAMNSADSFDQYILLIKLLNLMVKDNNKKILASSFYTFENKTDISVDKLDKVIKHIYQHFTQTLNADELASLAYMSTNHFHRFFKQRTDQTLTQFINQLRIGKACKLLINSKIHISAISDQCGFRNISNFNRRFQIMKSCTPKEFRKSIHQPSPL